MLLYNIGPTDITIGTVTLPAQGSLAAAVDVPLQYLMTDSNALAALISGVLVPAGPPEVDWHDEQVRGYQGVWQAAISLTDSEAYVIPYNLFTGAFRSGRLHVITSAGSATVSLNSSADGGQNWCAIPDWTPLTSTSNTSSVLPAAVVLLQGTITAGSSGWTGSVEFTLL